MKTSVTWLATGLLALGASAAPSKRSNSGEPCALDTISIAAPDGSIKANFIRAGAHITNLYVKDKTGTFLDVILGYDDRSQYLSDPAHPYFGPIVGRYANRIKNSTFTLPTSGKTVHVAANENMGKDTLHGGFFGFDLRIWDLTASSSNSLTFSLCDPAGAQGFPSQVKASVTYTLNNNSKWSISMKAVPDGETPIMLSQHTYWNLEAYKYSQNLDNHYIQLQADRYIGTDGILIPTGKIDSVEGTLLDWRSPVQLGPAIQKAQGKDICGGGCTGYDTCWVYEDSVNKAKDKVKMSAWSTASGIRLDITTDQIAGQVYTCNGIANTRNITRKADQGGDSGATYENHSCFVLEQESYIDAINNPEWGINQFYKAGETYTWNSDYMFSVMKD